MGQTDDTNLFDSFEFVRAKIAEVDYWINRYSDGYYPDMTEADFGAAVDLLEEYRAKLDVLEGLIADCHGAGHVD